MQAYILLTLVIAPLASLFVALSHRYCHSSIETLEKSYRTSFYYYSVFFTLAAVNIFAFFYLLPFSKQEFLSATPYLVASPFIAASLAIHCIVYSLMEQLIVSRLRKQMHDFIVSKFHFVSPNYAQSNAYSYIKDLSNINFMPHNLLFCSQFGEELEVRLFFVQRNRTLLKLKHQSIILRYFNLMTGNIKANYEWDRGIYAYKNGAISIENKNYDIDMLIKVVELESIEQLLHMLADNRPLFMSYITLQEMMDM